MKILANENFPRIAVEGMRDAGHDVVWARTDMPGADDEAVLRTAQAQQRVVATFDKDFGQLAYQWGLQAACGVILFRFTLASPDAAARRAVEVLAERTDWTGNFAVVDEFRVRLRALP